MLVLVAVSCSEQNAIAPIPEKEISSKILSHMREQEQSWNHGDIEGFMKHYWHSDSLKFIGSRGLTYGWQQTLDNYRKGYPDKDAMGRLQFDILNTEVLSDASAFVIGKWTLFRSADTLSGHYTLLWKKLNNQWVIVADHSS